MKCQYKYKNFPRNTSDPNEPIEICDREAIYKCHGHVIDDIRLRCDKHNHNVLGCGDECCKEIELDEYVKEALKNA